MPIQHMADTYPAVQGRPPEKDNDQDPAGEDGHNDPQCRAVQELPSAEALTVQSLKAALPVGSRHPDDQETTASGALHRPQPHPSPQTAPRLLRYLLLPETADR